MIQPERDKFGNEVYLGHRQMSVRQPEPDFEVTDEKPKPVKKKSSSQDIVVLIFFIIVAMVMFSMCTSHNDDKKPVDPFKNIDQFENRIDYLSDTCGYSVKYRCVLQKNQSTDIEVENPPQVRRWRIIADKPVKLELWKAGTLRDTATLRANEIRDFGAIEYDNDYLLQIRIIALHNKTRVAYLTKRS